MANLKRHYRVTGKLYSFGNYVGEVDDYTWAVTEGKARANVLFRNKIRNGFTGDSKFEFKGIVTEV